jgi:ketosteroid isomerase-like protein
VVETEDRREAVCQVLRDFHMGDEWDAAIEDGIPPELASILGEMLDAYRNADIDWLLEHTDPDIVITQIAELPGAQTYRGCEGFIDALLDWPLQWLDFQIEPLSLFAVGDEHLVISSIHRGRPASMDIEVEAQIVFLMRWRDRRLTDWNIFMTVEEAVAAAEAR